MKFFKVLCAALVLISSTAGLTAMGLSIASTAQAKGKPVPPSEVILISEWWRGGTHYERLLVDGQECLQVSSDLGNLSSALAIDCDWRRP